MKIVVITGSPHRKGTSFLLADRFIEGAKEAGHEIYRFDAAFEEVHPCIACEKCENGVQTCVFADSMEKLNPHLLAADMVVFVSPVYYFGMAAQIKTVIDRFYGNNEALCGQKKKTALLMTAADDTIGVMRGSVSHYEDMIGYLGWEDCGRILAVGCGVREDIEASDYPQRAWELGRKL